MLRYRLFGNTGLRVSEICLGTMSFGDAWGFGADEATSHAVLDRDQVEAFHAAWLDAVPGSLASATEPWLCPLRRIMWLWSVTWCAKWRVESRRDVGGEGATENWSAELSDDALVAHVAGLVADYLDPETIARVRADWQLPAEAAGPAVARAV